MKTQIVTCLMLALLICYTTNGQTLTLHDCKAEVRSSFRGLSVVDDNIAWVSGSSGWIGKTSNGTKQWEFKQVSGFEKLDFRSLYAFDSQNAIIANAGSPAHILKTSDGGNSWQVVYQNIHPDAFFDGIDFWNNREGMIYGDPIEGHMLLLITKDGGTTWTEIPKSQRPVVNEGEASFAASGTGIRCYGKSKVIISTGGKSSRLFVSDNKGFNWTVLTPPMLQGESSTGIFSTAFHDNKGIVVGGDYLQDSLTVKHVLLTTDTGNTWQTPVTPTRGYRECVEYISNEVLIATGPSGTDVSYNEGQDWQPLSDEKGFHVVRKARKGKLIVVAGNGKISRVSKGD